LTNAALELLQKNGATQGRAVISTTITRGITARGLQAQDDNIPNIIMQIFPPPEKTPPMNVIIAQSARRNEGSQLSRIKSLNYGDNIMAMREAQAAKANDAIMLNNAGNIACFTTGNIFILKEGILSTPPLSDGAIDGIIRRKWMRLVKIRERSIPGSALE